MLRVAGLVEQAKLAYLQEGIKKAKRGSKVIQTEEPFQQSSFSPLLVAT